MLLAVFSWEVAMTDLPRKEKVTGRGEAICLKTRKVASHNETSPDERIIKLVKLMARRAAQTDFDATVAKRPNRGGQDHDTAH